MSDKRIVILISGRGSNMEALLNAPLGGTVDAVISNRSEAKGLTIARARGVASSVVDDRAYADRPAFDAALGDEIEKRSPHLVVLAGFMRILTASFIARFEGKLLNIHPSLLPAFPGLHTHRQALAAGTRIHGCTVHFVTGEVDGGPIVAQAAVPVLPSDSEETLAARVLEQEHRILPMAVAWFCAGRIRLGTGRKVHVDGARSEGCALLSPAPDGAA